MKAVMFVTSVNTVIIVSDRLFRILDFVICYLVLWLLRKEVAWIEEVS